MVKCANTYKRPYHWRSGWQYVISRVPEIDGFFGASSIERFAAERGIEAQSAAFKAIQK